MFTDVSVQEHRFADMTPERFKSEVRDLIESDDLVREYLRYELEAYDARRSGGAAPAGGGGLAPGADAASGSLRSQAAPGSVPRGRIH
jgi:hypothetical protein